MLGNDDGDTEGLADGNVLGASVTSTTEVSRVVLVLPSLVKSGSLVTFSRESWAASMKADSETGSVSLLVAFPLFELALRPADICTSNSIANPGPVSNLLLLPYETMIFWSTMTHLVVVFSAAVVCDTALAVGIEKKEVLSMT